jgi:hypothetical protein
VPVADLVKIFFVSSPELPGRPDILKYLDSLLSLELESEIDNAVDQIDVVYQRRIRPESITDVNRLERYAIDSTVLQP